MVVNTAIMQENINGNLIMKMYLNEQQTAKLIELGVDKPKGSHSYWRGNELVININYSIGELLSFLPTSYGGDDYYSLTIRGSKVMYCDPYLDWIEAEWGKHEELIDNLFDACVELKKEGTI